MLEVTHAIHSLDSLRLAEEINNRAERMDKIINVMLQVNCSGEDQKSGCAVGAALHLGDMICSLNRLRLIGLMTMAPLTEDSGRVRSCFTRMKELFQEMQKARIGGDSFEHMSMGMSQDYIIAVEEGATILRLGTALFE